MEGISRRNRLARILGSISTATPRIHWRSIRDIIAFQPFAFSSPGWHRSRRKKMRTTI